MFGQLYYEFDQLIRCFARLSTYWEFDSDVWSTIIEVGSIIVNVWSTFKFDQLVRCYAQLSIYWKFDSGVWSTIMEVGSIIVNVWSTLLQV